MTRIQFPCDRCDRPVSGIHTKVGTAGFYVVDGSAWIKYRRGTEHFVCDDCVQSMPEYREDYKLDEAK
jgi:hypothetical protein